MGFLSKGQVPVLHFIEEPWDSHVLNKNILKQNLQTSVNGGEKKNLSLESSQGSAFREREWIFVMF